MAAPARLPESVQTLYAELLDQHVIAAAEREAEELPPPGSFVSKTIRGARYWYLQRSEAGARRQVYLGPESAALLGWMEDVQAARARRAPDRERRREIVRMLRASGAAVPDAATGRLVQVLAERGLFRVGSLLVGTHAFACLGNLLGIGLAGRMARTADVDLLQDPTIFLLLNPEEKGIDVPEALREAEPDFLAVPPLDRRHPSASFKVRGRDLRVDFLVPARGRERKPRPIPYLGVAAQPLRGLEYLLEHPTQAVVLHDDGILVGVPDPARFALHKLWLATDRPTALQTKAGKDRHQALTLLAALGRDRPGDLTAAWRALSPGVAKRLRKPLEDAAADSGLDVSWARAGSTGV